LILLAATLVAILVGTAYYAGAGFWKKPRLAMVTFVSLFVPAVVLLPLSGWEFPLLEWSSGWAYLLLLYLAVHLAGLLAWFWAMVAERAVRLFHKVKVGLAIFLGLGALWYILAPYIVMGGEEVLWIIAGLIVIAIAVAGGQRLFRILREKKYSKTVITRLKNLLKNMCAQVRMKIHAKDGRAHSDKAKTPPS